MKKSESNGANSLSIALLLLVLIALNSVFFVFEGQNALVQRFGKFISDDSGQAQIYKPGLHFVIPLIDAPKYIDIRIQTFSVPSDRIYTVEQKTVKIDYYVKWRVKDVRKFFLTTSANYNRSNNSLRGKINDALRAEVGQRELIDVITGERSNIIAALKRNADESAENFGIEVIDVRIVRLDYPTEVSQSVYNRMKASRERMATMYRAEGDEESEAIRAQGDAHGRTAAAGDRGGARLDAPRDGLSGRHPDRRRPRRVAAAQPAAAVPDALQDGAVQPHHLPGPVLARRATAASWAAPPRGDLHAPHRPLPDGLPAVE